jgi:hypothetical protein
MLDLNTTAHPPGLPRGIQLQCTGAHLTHATPEYTTPSNAEPATCPGCMQLQEAFLPHDVHKARPGVTQQQLPNARQESRAKQRASDMTRHRHPHTHATTTSPDLQQSVTPVQPLCHLETQAASSANVQGHQRPLRKAPSQSPLGACAWSQRHRPSSLHLSQDNSYNCLAGRTVVHGSHRAFLHITSKTKGFQDQLAH